MAVHGWLDNAASFDRLAPRLSGCHVLALDLSGHGHSDHKPPHATYNLWDDLLIILAVADAMQWERFVLLGHSRGAMMSVLLAAAAPERVTTLICLDGLLPMAVSADDAPRQLGDYLRDYRKLGRRDRPGYASFEEVVAARRRAIEMSEESATAIVRRATKLVDGRYVWHSDPRLKAASAFKLTAEHCDAMVNAVQMPALLILAEQGIGQHDFVRKNWTKYATLDVQSLPGGHHFHMDEPEVVAIAESIGAFLDKHIKTA